MTKNLKIKLLIYSVIFLTVLNIAAIGTIVWHSERMRKIEQAAATSRYKPGLRHNKTKHLPRVFRNLDLTPEQQQQFMNEHRKFIVQVKPLFRQLQQLHQNLALQLKRPNPDLDSIKYYSEKIGQVHSQLTYLEAKEFIALAKICTPQQRQKLYQLYTNRFRRYGRLARKYRTKIKKDK